MNSARMPMINKYIRAISEEYPEKDFESSLMKARVAGMLEAKPFEFIEYKQFCKYLLLHYNYECERRGVWEDFGGILRECTGLIVDLSTMNTIIRPYAKYFELGTMSENSKLAIMDKVMKGKILEVADVLDGEEVYVSFIDKKLFISSRCEFGIGFGNKDVTDAELFNTVSDYWLTPSYRRDVLKKYENHTFVFTYIGADRSTFVKYSSNKYSFDERADKGNSLVLTGVINNVTGRYKALSEVARIAAEMGISTIGMHEGVTFTQVLDSLDDWRVTDKIGYLISIDDLMLTLSCDEYKATLEKMRETFTCNKVVRLCVDKKLTLNTSYGYKAGMHDIYTWYSLAQEYERVASDVVLRVANDIKKEAGKDAAEFFRILRKKPVFLHRPIGYLFKTNKLSVFKYGKDCDKVYTYEQLVRLLDKYKEYEKNNFSEQ